MKLNIIYFPRHDILQVANYISSRFVDEERIFLRKRRTIIIMLHNVFMTLGRGPRCVIR
jgi:hypothetical protein